MQKVRIQTRHSLTRLVSVAMLSAVALVLYLLEFPLLPAATYLKMDFSAYFEAYQLPEHSSFFTGNY